MAANENITPAAQAETDQPCLSVVIPAHNEQDNLGPLTQELAQVLSELGKSYEIILVDDGSTDDTYQRALELRQSDPCIGVLQLSRNFGHQAALMAGIEAARGEAVITLDADFQHPPAVVPQLVERWKEGHEIVLTVRQHTEQVGWLKRLSSRVFYLLMQRFSRVDLPAGAADFRLLDRAAVAALLQMPERSRFLRGMVSWLGFRAATVTYDAPARAAGQPGYDWRRMVHLAADAVTSFSVVPLYFAVYLGCLVSVLSFAYLVYVVTIWATVTDVERGWASTLGAVLFLGGVQLLTIGVIGLYLGRVLTEVKGRPLYVVRRRHLGGRLKAEG